MAARTTPEHGDRVTWRGQKGTIIDTHAKTQGKDKVVPPNFSVLPDVGPNRLAQWPKDECEVGIGVYPSQCPRCGGPHRAPSCQAEYLAWKEGRKKESFQVDDPWGVDF